MNYVTVKYHIKFYQWENIDFMEPGRIVLLLESWRDVLHSLMSACCVCVHVLIVRRLAVHLDKNLCIESTGTASSWHHG